MNPQIETTSPNQNTPEQPPQIEPNPIPQTPEPQRPKKSRKPLIIAAITTVLIIISGAVIFGSLNNNMTMPATENTEPVISDFEQIQTEQATTTTSVTRGNTSIQVTHPSSWEVTENPTDGYNGPNPVNTTIISGQGTTLRLISLEGLGGGCTDDTYEFTLIKKLATATEGYYFTEYSTTDPSFPNTPFRIDRSGFDVASKDEGATGVGVCQTITFYSAVGDNSTNSDIFIQISPQTQQDESILRYSDISGDEDFVSMLQSIQITVAE